MRDISYSTAGFKDRELSQALEAIAAAGFDCFELVALAPHIPDALVGERLAPLRQAIQASGLTPRTMHGTYDGIALGWIDERRFASVAVLTQHLRMCGELGISQMVVHPTIYLSAFPEAALPENKPRIRRAVRQSVEELAPVAEDAGVCMMLECLPHGTQYAMTTMGDLRPLVDDFPAEHVGLIVDTGHAASAGLPPEDEIRVAGDRLRGVHLQDVPAQGPRDNHWAPGDGGLNWPAIRKALEEVGYPGAWTFEVINAIHGETPDELAGKTRAWARDTWGIG